MLEFLCMHPAIPHLIELQRVDHLIAALRAELEAFPKRIREADAKLSGARAAVAAAKEAHVNSQKERKKFELDVEQWKDRARKYRDQSGAVKTNEAYKALQHEITNAEAEAAKAEDRQLEIMVAGEEAERRVKIAEARLKEAELAATSTSALPSAIMEQRWPKPATNSAAAAACASSRTFCRSFARKPMKRSIAARPAA